MPVRTLTPVDLLLLEALAFDPHGHTIDTDEMDPANLHEFGYATCTGPEGTVSLTTAGALAALALLASWSIPADAGDPAVVILCARSALGRAEGQGFDPAVARMVVNDLLEVAGFDRLGDDVGPWQPDPEVLAEARKAMAAAEADRG